MIVWNWYHPVKVTFGKGILESALGALTLEAPVAIVTGKSSLEKRGFLKRVKEILGSSVVFHGKVESEPTWQVIENLRDEFIRFGIKTVLAIGGGSVLDAAKLSALLVNNREVSVREVIGVRDYPFKPSPCKVVAIPTTSGSGSEVTPYSIVIDRESFKKASIGSRFLYPFCAINDPVLTYDTPFKITRDSGIDAFSHLIEILFMKELHPIAVNFSISGIKLFFRFFANALNNDQLAREKMMLGSLYGGYAISNVGAGLVHQFAHAVGVIRGYSHGHAISLCLLPVIDFYAKRAPERIKEIEGMLGVRNFVHHVYRILGDAHVFEDVRPLSNEELEMIVEIVRRRESYFDRFIVKPTLEDLYSIVSSGLEHYLYT